MDPRMIDKTVYIYIEGFVACTMASQWASQLMDIMENIEGEKSGKRANENMDIMGEWPECNKKENRSETENCESDEIEDEDNI